MEKETVECSWAFSQMSDMFVTVNDKHFIIKIPNGTSLVDVITLGKALEQIATKIISEESEKAKEIETKE